MYCHNGAQMTDQDVICIGLFFNFKNDCSHFAVTAVTTISLYTELYRLPPQTKNKNIIIYPVVI